MHGQGASQLEQKPRSAYREDRYLVGWPLTHVKESIGKWTKASAGAPECFRHIEQWQITARRGAAMARYRTAPQRHPPSNVTLSTIPTPNEPR
jgi:hypothetical protein